MKNRVIILYQDNKNPKAIITGMFDVFISLELWQNMITGKSKNTR